MNIKVVIALLLIMIMCALQVSCCQYEIKIEKVIIERETDVVSDKNLIH